MAAGLVKGEGFAVDASVMEANASRYHGKAPDEIVWAESKRQTRAVKEYLAGLGAETEHNPDRKPPKVISPSDPCSAWTAKANKRVQFGYGLNYLIDSPARRFADRIGLIKIAAEERSGLCPGQLGEPPGDVLGSRDAELPDCALVAIVCDHDGQRHGLQSIAEVDPHRDESLPPAARVRTGR